jgi:hypothetical protein
MLGGVAEVRPIMAVPYADPVEDMACLMFGAIMRGCGRAFPICTLGSADVLMIMERIQPSRDSVETEFWLNFVSNSPQASEKCVTSVGLNRRRASDLAEQVTLR